MIVILGGYIKDFEKAENYTVKELVKYYNYLYEYMEARYGS